MQNLKEDKLESLVDDSVKRCEYQHEWIFEIFTGYDGVLQSARVQTAHEELKMPVVKFSQYSTTVFPRSKTGPAMFPGPAMLPLRKIGYKIHQTAENNLWNWKD